MFDIRIVKKYNETPEQIKASFWFFICLLLQKGINIITTPIYTRVMNTEEFGKFNVFNSWMSIITIFVTLNLSGGVYLQGLVKFDDNKDVFSSSLQGLTFLLLLISAFIYFLFSKFWNKIFSLTNYEILLMLLVIWTTAIYNFWATYQRVSYKYVKLVVLTLISSVFTPIFSVILIINFSNKVLARITGIALVHFICYIYLFIFQLKKGGQFCNIKFWKYAVLYNLPLIPHYLSQVLLNNADHIMISKMIGNRETGIYSLSYSLSSLILFFSMALNSSLGPWIYKKIKEKKINQIANVAYISLIMVAIATIFLIIFSPEIVSIFAPKEYYESIWVIPPVAMGLYFTFSYDLFAKFAFYYEKTVNIMVITMTGAVLNILLNYIFIKKYGYIAAGYTTLICYMVYSIGHYVCMNRICDKEMNGVRPYKLGKLLLITIIFIVLGFIIMLTYNNLFFRYCIALSLVIVFVLYYKKIIFHIKRIINRRSPL